MAVSLGPRLRTLRREKGLSQAALATKLNISASYLNLIESGKRPLPAEILLAAARELDADLRSLAGEGEARLVHDLVEALADPVLESMSLSVAEARGLANREPELCRALIRVHQALRTARDTQGALANQVYAQEGDTVSSRMPPEEVTDLIEDNHNYFATLEDAAEGLCRDAHLDPQSLFPGLRIGYVVLPPQLAPHSEPKLRTRRRMRKNRGQAGAGRPLSRPTPDYAHSPGLGA